MQNFYPYSVVEQTPHYLCLKLRSRYRAAWFILFRILPWIIAGLALLSVYHMVLDGKYILLHAFYFLLILVVCAYLFSRRYALQITFQKGQLSVENNVYYRRTAEPFFFYLSDTVNIHKIRGRSACWVFSKSTDRRRIRMFFVPITFFADAKEVKDSFSLVFTDICKVTVTDQAS